MDPRLLRVNQYGVLRVPVSMWWCFLFLLRNSILLVVVLVSSMQGSGTTGWAYGLISWPVLLFEVPMWLLMYALTRRLPAGGRWPRRIWARGREILSLSAGLGVVWAAWFLIGQEEWRPWPERFILFMALINIAIIVGCWRSVVYRAVFAEFPVNPATLRASA